MIQKHKGFKSVEKIAVKEMRNPRKYNNVNLFYLNQYLLYLTFMGVVCNLVISVDVRPYFTGIALKLFPPQIQHKTLQSRKRNGIEHNEH